MIFPLTEEKWCDKNSWKDLLICLGNRCRPASLPLTLSILSSRTTSRRYQAGVVRDLHPLERKCPHPKFILIILALVSWITHFIPVISRTAKNWVIS
jgi:hypothetical protein